MTSMWTLLLTLSTLIAQDARAALAERLDDYLTRLESRGFSGAVLVADREGVVLEAGYGLADREAGRPVTPDTVFTCGSISKQFTAAALLRLQKAGELSVDDALVDHFDGVPEDKRHITLHDLLIHGSGLPSSFAGDFEPVSRAEFLERVFAGALLFEPGTGFNYSNAGYSLLAMVIEDLTGRPYEEYLRAELLEPAGMRDTGYLLPAYEDGRLARGYVGSDRWGTLLERPMDEDGPYWGLRGNGGIHTTIRDMYRWHLALEGDVLFGDADRELLYGRHNPEPGGGFYGYGWSLVDTDAGSLVTHNGGNDVFAADFLRYLERGTAVYLATNTASFPAYEVSEAIGRLALGGSVELPPRLIILPPEELARYSGAYTVEAGAEKETVSVLARADALELVATTPRAFELVMGDQPPPGSPGDQLARRSLAAIEAAAAGEFGPLSREFGMDEAVVARRQAGLWSGLTAELGAFAGNDLLGVRRTRGGDDVYLVLRFEGGVRYLVLSWEGRRVGGLLVREEPPRRRVLPLGPRMFLDPEPGAGDWSVSFEPGGEEAPPVAALFDTWRGEVRAPRAAD